MKKIIGLFIVTLLITTILPCADASINTTDQKESKSSFESMIFGIGFVRINSFTHAIKGFVFIWR